MIKVHSGDYRSRRLPTVRRGATLLELVLSITAASVLLVGMQASLFVAIKCLPDAQSSSTTSLQASKIVDNLATELETAVYVTERSATVIGFTVPDRNGDGLPERIRYSWTGTPGGGLTRQFNGGTLATIAASVDLFSLTPTFKTVAETYPGSSVEDVAESLLIDNYSISGTGNNDASPTAFFGQYYTLTLPAGVYAWRPTRVQFMARRNSVPGTSLVQMRPATVNLIPSNTILEQYTLRDSMMTGTYAYQSFNFNRIDPISSGGAICLTVVGQTGSKSVTVQSTSGFVGLEKTGSNGTVWSYDTGKSLVSQLYGKLTRSGGTQTLNSNYLKSYDIALRMAGTSPTLRTSAALLNHPEMLSGKWELKFDQNPTTVDINGDATNDWVVNGGGAFAMSSLVTGVWQTSGVQLSTNPNCDFAKTTVIDVKFRNTSVGGNGAIFAINGLRSGSTMAPILVYLKLQTDGTQSLSLATKSDDATTKTLINLTGLAPQPVLLHLIIDPVAKSVSIEVNDVQYGNYPLTPFASSDSNRSATLGANGSNAEFSYARIRVLEQ